MVKRLVAVPGSVRQPYAAFPSVVGALVCIFRRATRHRDCHALGNGPFDGSGHRRNLFHRFSVIFSTHRSLGSDHRCSFSTCLFQDGRISSGCFMGSHLAGHPCSDKRRQLTTEEVVLCGISVRYCVLRFDEDNVPVADISSGRCGHVVFSIRAHENSA
jgi:hypothetical protein